MFGYGLAGDVEVLPNKKPFGCKYTRNRSTSQNLFLNGGFVG